MEVVHIIPTVDVPAVLSCPPQTDQKTVEVPQVLLFDLSDKCTYCDAATIAIEAESLEHEVHVPSFNEAQQLKVKDFLDSILRRMNDKDKFRLRSRR